VSRAGKGREADKKYPSEEGVPEKKGRKGDKTNNKSYSAF